MAHEILARDGNRRNVMGGVTNDSSLFVTMLRVDPTTKRLLVDATVDLGADVVDLTTRDALAVAIVDGNGDQITSFGGGVQYTEGDTDATITGTAVLMEAGSNTLVPFQGSVADGLLVNLGANNDVSVTGTVDLGATDNAVLDAIAASVAAIDTDATTIIGHVDGIETALTAVNASLDAIEASVASIDTDTTTIIGHLDGVESLLTTIDTDTGNIATSVQLIDDTIFTAGTDTYAEATSKGQLILAVRRDADTTLANTTNEMTPLQVDANGYLKVEIFDGGGSHTVDNNGTFVVQIDGAALTALQLIDNLAVAVDGNYINVNANIAGTDMVGGAGSVSPGVQRVTLASDDPAVVALQIMDDWDNGASDGASVSGDVAHDGVDAGEPVKLGGKAIAHGTNPTGVAANDRTNWYFNRAGVPFMIGGHPNSVTVEAAYTAAQTDAAIITISTGTKIVVTAISVTCDNANSVDVGYRVGFGTANTPTTTGVVSTHPGVAPGSGVVEGNGGGIIGIGADNEDLRITCEVPTGGSIRVKVTYYTIES